jgi:hypothetical protein
VRAERFQFLPPEEDGYAGRQISISMGGGGEHCEGGLGAVGCGRRVTFPFEDGIEQRVYTNRYFYSAVSIPVI